MQDRDWGQGMSIRRWLLGSGLAAFAALALGADSCGTSSSNTGDKGSGGDKQQASGDKSSSDCASKATNDCTPHVGPNDKVRVDALTWQVRSAEPTKTIGDQQYGLGQKADGMFVVVKLKVHSAKTESATITDETIQLEAPGGRTYKPDSDGTVAAVG